jgi:hypothetical protein
MKREGDAFVLEEKKAGKGEGEKSVEEMMTEMFEEGEGGIVVMEEEEEGSMSDKSSRTSDETRRVKTGFDFLDGMQDETVDEDLEKTRKNDRKKEKGRRT